MKTDNYDPTCDQNWIHENMDRLLGWELLRKFSKGEWDAEMKTIEICDRIGVPPRYIYKTIKSAKDKVNGQ